MTILSRGGFLISVLIVAVLGTACSDTEPWQGRSDNLVSPLSPGITSPSLSPDGPLVIGEGPNSVTPSGNDQVGFDATDSLCAELKRDLDESITGTLRSLREAGMSSEFMPSRNDLKKELSGALRANGCSGF